jgi:hypothetical protein
MAQSQMARIICTQCNAWYDSERELRDHMQAAHRHVDSEQSLPPSSVQADSPKLSPETQPHEEKEAGGESAPDGRRWPVLSAIPGR